MKIVALTKRYGRQTALSDVSFEMEQGCTALLGPNGAGKTTLITCIAGLVSASSGSVKFEGASPCHRKIGYLPQQFSFLPELTVLESLSYLGLLGGIRQKDLLAEVKDIIEQANLSMYIDARVKALSGGTLRRLGIAQALLGSPELLLLDEPTVGLDIEERGKLKAILARIKFEHRMLLSTHLVEDVVGLCDRILVLKEGTLCFDGTADELAAFANGHVCVSADESPTLRGGIASSSSFSTEMPEYRFVMPLATAECDVKPTLEEGYLALMHDIAV